LFVPFFNYRLRRPRGRAAGVRRRQQHFLQFLYDLSTTSFRWGPRRNNRRR